MTVTVLCGKLFGFNVETFPTQRVDNVGKSGDPEPLERLYRGYPLLMRLHKMQNFAFLCLLQLHFHTLLSIHTLLAHVKGANFDFLLTIR